MADLGTWACWSSLILLALVIVGGYLYQQGFRDGHEAGWQYAQDQNRRDDP